MSNCAAIGNGLYVRIGSGKPRRTSATVTPRPGMHSFVTSAAIFNWARKVNAGTCSVLVREGFRYKRMEIAPKSPGYYGGQYEGRWV